MSAPTFAFKHNPLVKQTMRDLLLFQYRASGDLLLDVLDGLAFGVQGLENDVAALVFSSTLDAATGPLLDRIGERVGVARDGLTNDDYADYIRVAVRAYRSKGSTDELINIASLAFSADNVNAYSAYPAGFVLYVFRSTLLAPIRVGRSTRLMLQVKPAGVTMLLIEVIPGFFGFSANPRARGFNAGVLARQLHPT